MMEWGDEESCFEKKSEGIVCSDRLKVNKKQVYNSFLKININIKSLRVKSKVRSKWEGVKEKNKGEE